MGTVPSFSHPSACAVERIRRTLADEATARQVAASEVLLDVDAGARHAFGIDPALVVDGATPRLIDEWQLEPEIWNYVRRAADDRGFRSEAARSG